MNTQISTPRTISFAQSQTAMKAQNLIGAVNAEIGQVLQADEQPMDQKKGSIGEVFIQTDQVEVGLKYQPGTQTSYPTPKEFISNAKSDIKTPQGHVITPKGTSSGFELREDGTQKYVMQTPRSDGQVYSQEAIVDPNNESITFQEWLIAT